MAVPIAYYLVLSAILFSIGVGAFLIKRNIITVFMSIELMLNAVNLAFIEHFQDVARGHFTVRRLERVYGADLVRAEYHRLKCELA